MIFWTCEITIDKMNENKKGKPYSFPDSFIIIMGYIRMYFIYRSDKPR
jgi:hypothetical protein